MTNDLTRRIEECVEAEDGDKAAAILESYAAEIADAATLTSLVELALADNSDHVSRFYAGVIGRVDAKLAADLNDWIALHDDRSELFKVLRDAASAPHHTAILEAFDLKSTLDNEIAELLVQVGDKLSRENKLFVARTILPNEEPTHQDLATAFSVLVPILDDDTVVKIVDKMAVNS